MIGLVYTKLTVIKQVESKGSIKMFFCECSCGGTKIASGKGLRAGDIKSCGCIKRDPRENRRDKPHYQKLKKLLRSAIERCYIKKCRNYSTYGGRGITVCNEWRDNPEAFCVWGVANGFSPELQLDRINNDGPYSPENCRWITRKENCRNKRTNRIVRVSDTISVTLQEAVETYSVVSWSTVNSRLRAGWPDDAAIILPYIRNAKIKPKYYDS